MFVARKLFFSASMVSSSAVRKNAWRGSRNRFPVMDRFFSLSDRSEVTSSPSVATIADAKAMPRHYNEMPGSVILNMAVSGKPLL